MGNTEIDCLLNVQQILSTRKARIMENTRIQCFSPINAHYKVKYRPLRSLTFRIVVYFFIRAYSLLRQGKL